MTQISVLLVDDNADDADLLIAALESARRIRFQVTHVGTFASALRVLAAQSADVILLDLSLPDAHGETAVAQMSEAFPNIPIIIVTGYNDEEFALELIRHRAQDYLVKGEIDTAALIRSIRHSIERKRIAVELSSSEARYRAIVEDQTELICRILPDGTLTFVNGAFAHYFDQPEAALMGQNAVALLPGENLRDAEASFAALSPEQPTTTFEFCMNTPDGSRRWQHWNIRALFDAEEQLLEFQVVGRDITQRKKAEEALRESEEKFRSIVETTSEWIWATDKDGLLTYSNPALEAILGYRVEDWLGKVVFEYLHPEDRQFESAWDEHMERSLGWSGVVLRWRHKDGTYRYVESNATPILNANGEMIGFRGSDRDITERKRIEARQREYEVEGERARMFKRFIGGVSHDLRTPLTIISTSLDLLRRAPMTDFQARHIDKLEVQYQRIHSIVEDLFSLLRLDTETPEQTRRPLVLNSIVETVFAQQLPVAQKKNLHMRLQLDAEMPLVMVNPSEMTQAVTQLVVNALNYTPPGGEIVLTTYQQGRQAMFKIEDSGIGISTEDIPHVFERFYRADKARSTETGGSGIGLAITQKIIETHGGRIWVESVLGQGSIFYFSLPLVGQ